MPPVLSSITAFKTNITGGGGWDALAAVSGDSLAVIQYRDGSRAYVEEVISGNSGAKMEVSVYSPRFGDNQYGLRMEHQFNPTTSGADGDPQLLLPRQLDIPIYSTDTLNVQVFGTLNDDVDVVLQVYYEDIPGAGARLASWEMLQGNIERVLGIEVTVTPGTTNSPGTAVAINANDDRFQADMDYALLGWSVDQPATCFRLYGPDTGFYKVPMPGHWDARITSGWFIDQDAWRPTPHIPVLNANNKAVTFLDGVSSSNVGATKVALVLAQLRTHFNR